MAAKQKTFTEQIRHLIDASGETCYRIGKETGIDTATLSRFMNGKGGLAMPNLHALAEHLGWTETTKATPTWRKGR